MDKKLSHVDASGKANMVNVGDKPVQKRIAKASGFIRLQPKTIELIQQNQLYKGDVLTVAEIAGIQSAKQTAQLIPLCHTLIIDKVDVKMTIEPAGIKCESTVYCQGRTGVEMEALTAVNIALLTIYDMCKAVDKTMVMEEIRLVEKTKS
jgi:cyclic pyranopterin phosphate synthase